MAQLSWGRQVAGRCEETLEYGIHTYVDEKDDPVIKTYAAMPTRLYLAGKDGRIQYAGGLVPFGFKPAELKEAIETYLIYGSQSFGHDARQRSHLA